MDETRGQLIKRVIAGSAVNSYFLVATPSIAAAHDVLFSSDNGTFIAFGGIGLTNIKAQEFVYNGAQSCTNSGWGAQRATSAVS